MNPLAQGSHNFNLVMHILFEDTSCDADFFGVAVAVIKNKYHIKIEGKGNEVMEVV